MTGGKNILSYMTTEGKLKGSNNILDYLQKNSGVFNQNGMIEKDELERMKERAAKNQGAIWHGFVSLNEEESHKIDTPEKCIDLVKRTFNSFFKEAHLDKDNLDLMCALHLDRPHHLHIHYIFYEKEPKYRGKDGELHYRSKGKIDKKAIDNMFVRLGLFIDDNKDNLHNARDKAIKELREMTSVDKALELNKQIRKEVIKLSKDLHKTGRLSYGSKDMESYRGRVDIIVKLLLDYDGKARDADKEFYKALYEKENVIKNICGKPFASLDANGSAFPEYHHRIDEGNIKIIDDIENDYRKRQGNLVINLAKEVKSELYERKKGKRYKSNDNNLKRSIGISEKKIGRLIDKFLLSFTGESQRLSNEHRNRLREIEKEMMKEKAEEEKAIEQKTNEEVKY